VIKGSKREITMGASAWRYVAEWTGSLESSLRAVQQQDFDEPDSFFRAELAKSGLPAPAPLEDLWYDADYDEFMGALGTHSILDTPHMGEDVMQLTAAETQSAFGVARPTRERIGTEPCSRRAA
jgi:hypothetical protein